MEVTKSSSVTLRHSAGLDVSRVELCRQPLRSLVHQCVCSESHDDRSRPFSRGATKKRWYRRPDDDEDDDHDVSHTPTGRLHREEGRRTREVIVRAGNEKVGVREEVFGFAGFSHAEIKKRKAEKRKRRRPSSPGRRGFLSSAAGSTPPRVGSAAAPQDQ